MRTFWGSKIHDLLALQDFITEAVPVSLTDTAHDACSDDCVYRGFVTSLATDIEFFVVSFRNESDFFAVSLEHERAAGFISEEVSGFCVTGRHRICQKLYAKPADYQRKGC